MVVVDSDEWVGGEWVVVGGGGWWWVVVVETYFSIQPNLEQADTIFYN